MAKSKGKVKAPVVALIGADTLMGRELQEVVKSRGVEVTIAPYASTGEGNFGEEDGEAIYREAFDTPSLNKVQAVLIAGTEAGAMKVLQLARDAGSATAGSKPVLIDCTGYLDRQPEAWIVSSLLEQGDAISKKLLVVAHPAASALSLVLTRLARRKQIRRVVAHVFEPASERGKRGIAELQQQTTGLLSFKTLQKEVFDDQLSFNLLAQYGADAPEKLSRIEQRIERHLAALLDRQSEKTPLPSLRLIQAPVFHGYSISVWIEFADEVNATELGEAIASAQIEVRGPEEETPHGVGATGQSGLIAGDIRVDKNDARSAWLWIVGDNLRLTADVAVEIVARLGTEQQ